MQVNFDYNPRAFTIRSYTLTGILVRLPIDPDRVAKHLKPEEENLTTSCVVFPDRLIMNWGVNHFEDLATECFTAIQEVKPELILLGTGDKIRFPPASVTAPLLAAGIGVEIMDNAAACRTYNILMTEGRYIAAALIWEG